ncbi:Reticulon [Niveomyces insectorum RCEF 264]|uniref:Reticulon-like protein n=1 Tax=Niveomyces insectorum RCEF 264 TaxID=1081102 RepID=A0A167N2F4_9HYPO|nr:Reticulon [Niveomyces insectorum RCEF 264]
MADTAGFPVTNGGIHAFAVKDKTTPPSTASSRSVSGRQAPATPTPIDETLTHYQSLFSELLSWNSPRASAIAYSSIVVTILAVKYLDVIRWGFKLTYLLLGVTVAAEIVGKLTIGNGLASQLRPRKYYTLPRETLDGIISDVLGLLNFFVVEAQRILYAENVYASAGACVAAFLSYYLVKVVPYWGLALIGTTVAFFAPLIYKTNKELIDEQLKNASDIVDAQTSQLREAANKHTAHATELTKQYMGDYTAKAQELLRGRSPQATPTPASVKPVPAKTTTSVPAAAPVAKPAAASTKQYDETDFPAAPKEDLKKTQAAAEAEEEEQEEVEEPLIAT